MLSGALEMPSNFMSQLQTIVGNLTSTFTTWLVPIIILSVSVTVLLFAIGKVKGWTTRGVKGK